MNSKKVLIYNKYLSTAGGGERACFDLAAALVKCGYHVIIASDDPLFSQPLEAVTNKFGTYKDLEYKKFDSLDEIVEYSKKSDLSLFINHTFASFLENPLAGTNAKGIYLMMFPRLNNAEQIKALNTYDMILSISEFSATYLDLYASRLSELKAKHEVLVLPISSSHIEAGDLEIEKKEKLIINIGRFNVRGHTKCQLDVIKMFKKLKSQNLIDSDWSLICAGHINQTQENIDYFNKCLSEAEGEKIELLSDISLVQMSELYKRASVLIQMTGFDLPLGENPEKCEHLGLVALDCMAYGVIPICCQRSGISAIIRHAVDGYLFADITEAKSYLSLISDNFKSKFHQSMLRNMSYTKDQNTFEQYTLKLNNLLSNFYE